MFSQQVLYKENPIRNRIIFFPPFQPTKERSGYVETWLMQILMLKYCERKYCFIAKK
jgi:hypothetical protein